MKKMISTLIGLLVLIPLTGCFGDIIPCDEGLEFLPSILLVPLEDDGEEFFCGSEEE